MLANKKSSPVEKSCISEIATDLHPMTHTYKNGRTEGVLRRSPLVPASEDPGITGVATRDVVVDRDTGLSARLFLPTGAVATGRRLPLVLFFHGDSSLLASESAFCHTYHRYATALAARARVLVLSVEYRLAPEHHPITAACNDAWTALRWAASSGDPWLLYHADRRCAFVSGDGAGGNIAYHTAVRAGRGGADIDVKGVVLVHPCFFLGPEWLPSEKAGHGGSLTPRQESEIASLPCRRALVAVAAEKRVVRQRERRFAVSMSGSWRGGKVTVVDLHSEEHGFHLCRTESASVEKLMESIVEFVDKKGPMLHDKNGVSSSGVMDCYLAPSLSNGPCKAVTADVPRRTVTKSCL